MKVQKTKKMVAWFFLLIVNGVLLFLFLSPVEAMTMKFHGGPLAREPATLLLLGSFLIGLAGFLKRIKKTD